MFASGSEDRGSLQGRVILKTQKMVLNSYLLNTQRYKVQIKSKWSNQGKGVVPFLHLGVETILKWNLRVAHDYGRPT